MKTAITPEVYPNLPRSIEVPMLKESNELRQQTTAQPQYSHRQASSTSSTSSTTSSSSSTSNSVNYVSSLPKATSLPTRRGRY
ncbi:PREDICTED: mitochondrial distribution and morphology protein 34-like [Drosophila arizonae]|uniref:Mitochondrial distribution and morphology protein 34-like n=1 Tax=Drosophila arizonae TaxID=7263 RepID=A0ABM1PS43_DROAR|nr:PREDICTED: mitochondrial distribution and morphology protein 34-like [Drosophila arizonae]